MRDAPKSKRRSGRNAGEGPYGGSGHQRAAGADEGQYGSAERRAGRATDPHSVWVPNTGPHTIRRRIQYQGSAEPLVRGIQASACGSQAAGFAILPSAGSTKDATRPAAVCADSDSAAGTPSAVAG